MSVAIDIVGVSKRFRLYHEKYTSLKERVIHMGRIPYDEFWALNDIDLEIKEGETIGLLGHNGSGKSTLLKCMAGILMPTSGEIRTVGRLAALLELGAGFHPDLTGRENVYMNASILGMSKREIDKRFDEIVGFAELERFIDNQVKYYSSGMYVRLGFAVAVNMDPDILLVDEVLAVGDELFQRKCIDRVKRFQKEGRTIVFVTHGADMVRQICDRAAVLDQGNMVALGTPGEAVRSYREHLLQRQAYNEVVELGLDETAPTADEPDGDEVDDTTLSVVERGRRNEQKRSFKIRITDVTFEPDKGGRPFEPGEELVIRIGYEAAEPMDDVLVGINVYDMQGLVVFATNTLWLDAEVPVLEGRGDVAFSFDPIQLGDGTFPVTVGLVSNDTSTVYDWREQGFSFEVLNPHRTAGLMYIPNRVTFNSYDSMESKTLTQQ
jgi:ABC-2 type transport system ATP-binding protein